MFTPEDSRKFRVPRSRAFETHEVLRNEILEALEPVLFGSGRAIHQVRTEFENAFAAEMEQAYGVAVHSATMGLFLALRACGIEPGDQVITVGNSDISTTGTIRHCGAIPVLCDIRGTDYTIDVDQVVDLISPQTRAILPVDLHGHPAHVKPLRDIADKHGLKIIEDAALAAGAMDYGKPVGAFADVTVFSFAPFKPLGSVSNGAMIVTSDERIHQRLRLLVGYGYDPDFAGRELGHQNYVDEGFNAPLDSMQAALLLVKLPYLKEWTARRRAIANAYETGLAGTSAKLPSFRSESTPTFRSYVIQVENQQHIHQQLRQAGVETVLHYTPPITHYTVYSGGLPNSHNLPVTERLAAQLVNLPVTPELTRDDTDYVITVLRGLLND